MAKAEFDRLRSLAKTAERESFDMLVRSAERDLPNPGPDFETHLDHLRSKVFSILLRQDGFIIDSFHWHAQNPHLFAEAELFKRAASDRGADGGGEEQYRGASRRSSADADQSDIDAHARRIPGPSD